MPSEATQPDLELLRLGWERHSQSSRYRYPSMPDEWWSHTEARERAGLSVAEPDPPPPQDNVLSLLREIRDELRGIAKSLDRKGFR